MASSSLISSGKYPKPIYMDHDLQTIPKLSSYTANYWKLAMHNYIEGNGLIGFIDGSIQPPMRVGDNPADYMEWKEIDDFVRQSIISTVRDDFLSMYSVSFNYAKTSAELWNFIIQNVRSPPGMTHPDRVSNLEQERPNFIQYLPLYKAAVEGNLKSLEEMLEKDPTVVRAVITGAYDTALMVASPKKENDEFVKRLISLMSPEDLAMQNSFGRTAIFGAAMGGCVEAMVLMVEKNPNLPNIRDIYNQIPLHLSAYTGQKDSVKYLLQFTNEEFLKDIRGLMIVHALISGGFFDICLSLLQQYPTLATIEVSPLETLIRRHSAFLSGSDFSFWQRMIYSYLPNELESLKNYCTSGDIENPLQEVVTVFSQPRQ